MHLLEAIRTLCSMEDGHKIGLSVCVIERKVNVEVQDLFVLHARLTGCANDHCPVKAVVVVHPSSQRSITAGQTSPVVNGRSTVTLAIGHSSLLLCSGVTVVTQAGLSADVTYLYVK